MIIRKPFAFLIKNFRKIHIFLFILSIYVAIKLFDVNSFVSNFMKVGIYDLYADPVSNHITSFLRLSVLLIGVGSLSLLFLLMYKKKQWKLYLVPTIEYFVLFFVLGMIKSFFANFSDDVATADLRLSKDLLLVFIIAQLPAMVIFFIRITGLDYKKFNFNYDKEFLELSEEDREEIEIGMSIDKNTFIRAYRRTIRNCKYFYMEHKIICYILGIILIAFIGHRTYQFVFVTHKTYKQGSVYNTEGYSFKVNKVYYSNKDYRGEVISNSSSFVIVDLTVQNHATTRKLKLEKFHIKSGSKDYVTTGKMYEKEFSDLGETYDTVKEIKKDEIINCILIFKVSKKHWKSMLQLFYQENNGYLRTIKINIKDLSKIKNEGEYKLGDELEIDIYNFKDSIAFESASVEDKVDYSFKKCTNSGICKFMSREFNSPEGYKILALDFSSLEVDAKKVVDFLKNYGKLNYKNSKGEKQETEIVNAIDKNYTGKTVYIRVPDAYTNDKSSYLDMVVRNKAYIYHLS